MPDGQVGRIFVGNEMLFEGYTSGASRETRDGLLDTGDLGRLNADGLLFVDGRADDMIVSGGENVFPSEVEDLLAQLPQVREVAVIGVPDPEYGQRLAAFLALHPGETLDPEAVREYVRHYLARFSVPRDVIFVKYLPRNATGKVLTRLRRSCAATDGPATACRALTADRSAGAVTAGRRPAAAATCARHAAPVELRVGVQPGIVIRPSIAAAAMSVRCCEPANSTPSTSAYAASRAAARSAPVAVPQRTRPPAESNAPSLARRAVPAWMIPDGPRR